MTAFLIDASNSEDNWSDVLTLWSRLANWIHYKPSERIMRGEIKQFLIALWNEKDWLKQQYPSRSGEIEEFINRSKYLPIVADLANMAKHRRLTKQMRSGAIQTNYFGRISVTNGAARRMHFIATGDRGHIEIMVLLRNALNELEAYRFELLAQASKNGL